MNTPETDWAGNNCSSTLHKLSVSWIFIHCTKYGPIICGTKSDRNYDKIVYELSVGYLKQGIGILKQEPAMVCGCQQMQPVPLCICSSI